MLRERRHASIGSRVLEAAGVPCGPVNNVAQALAHPQTAARNMLVEVDDPATGPLKLAGNPMKLSAFADPPTRAPAPDLDADRDEILRELGTGERLTLLPASGAGETARWPRDCCDDPPHPRRLRCCCPGPRRRPLSRTCARRCRRPTAGIVVPGPKAAIRSRATPTACR